MPRRPIETLNPRAPKAGKLDRAYPWIRVREKSRFSLRRTNTLTFAFPRFRTRTRNGSDQPRLPGISNLRESKACSVWIYLKFDYTIWLCCRREWNYEKRSFSEFLLYPREIRVSTWNFHGWTSTVSRISLVGPGWKKSTRARATRLDPRGQTMPSLGAIGSRGGGCFHLRKYWYRRVRARVPTPR